MPRSMAVRRGVHVQCRWCFTLLNGRAEGKQRKGHVKNLSHANFVNLLLLGH